MPLVHPILFGRPTIVDDLPPAIAREMTRGDAHALDAETLLAVTGAFATMPGTWRPLARHDPQRRWYTRLMLTPSIEVWLICWYPGQGTRVHDHGGAVGALTVADGVVDEVVHDRRDWSATGLRRYRRGESAAFSPRHVHQVVNAGAVPATTVHAYSPPELPLGYTAPAVLDRSGIAPPDIAPPDIASPRVPAAGPRHSSSAWPAPFAARADGGLAALENAALENAESR